MVYDPGGQKPHGEPLRVGLDPESDELVDIWFQDDKSKDAWVFALPNNRNGGIFGWGYVMRRSGGASRGEDGRRVLRNIHLCPAWPCPSDFRTSDGTMDIGKWAGFPPRHLVWQKDGWPAEGGGADDALGVLPPDAAEPMEAPTVVCGFVETES